VRLAETVFFAGVPWGSAGSGDFSILSSDIDSIMPVAVAISNLHYKTHNRVCEYFVVMSENTPLDPEAVELAGRLFDMARNGRRGRQAADAHARVPAQRTSAR